jgi:hypothetical protein
MTVTNKEDGSPFVDSTVDYADMSYSAMVMLEGKMIHLLKELNDMVS